MDNSKTQDFKVSAYWQDELKKLWLEFGHEKDIEIAQFEGREPWR